MIVCWLAIVPCLVLSVRAQSNCQTTTNNGNGGTVTVCNGGGGTGSVVKPGCIHGADLVLTPFGPKRIDQLKIGDTVAVGGAAFEPIVTFLHRDQARNTSGFEFRTSRGTVVTLSDLHLVFIAPNHRAVLAKNVKIGQRIYVVKDGDYAEEEITEIKRKEVLGRYSPLTPSGVILANGVLVSCYSQIEDHHLMHRTVNWLLKFAYSEAIFGIGGSLGNGDGLHWVGDVLWHYLRHWFVADTS